MQTVRCRICWNCFLFQVYEDQCTFGVWPSNPVFTAAQYNSCLDKFCSDFECPDGYDLVEDGDKTVCDDTGCTKDLCCDGIGKTSTVSVSSYH